MRSEPGAAVLRFRDGFVAAAPVECGGSPPPFVAEACLGVRAFAFVFALAFAAVPLPPCLQAGTLRFRCLVISSGGRGFEPRRKTGHSAGFSP